MKKFSFKKPKHLRFILFCQRNTKKPLKKILECRGTHCNQKIDSFIVIQQVMPIQNCITLPLLTPNEGKVIIKEPDAFLAYSMFTMLSLGSTAKK